MGSGRGVRKVAGFVVNVYVFKSSCSLLSYCYDKKKDKPKSDFYYKKYDEADKAHKQ